MNPIGKVRTEGFSRGGTAEELEFLADFFARVRGPGSLDAPFKVFPRPRGAATRVIIINTC